jgi:hypothetical protein
MRRLLHSPWHRAAAKCPGENGMQYIVVLVTILTCASGAIAQDMPRCSPKTADFSAEHLRTKSVDWEYRRAPGKGGAQYGDEYWVPDPERNVLVAWDAQESRCSRCDTAREVWIVERKKGRISYPAGVHVGVSMDTGGEPTGPGGAYQGTLTMQYVSYAQWHHVFVSTYLECE